MRLFMLIAVLSLAGLASCDGSDDSARQPRPDQPGLYISGGAGVGF